MGPVSGTVDPLAVVQTLVTMAVGSVDIGPRVGFVSECVGVVLGFLQHLTAQKIAATSTMTHSMTAPTVA